MRSVHVLRGFGSLMGIRSVGAVYAACVPAGMSCWRRHTVAGL